MVNSIGAYKILSLNTEIFVNKKEFDLIWIASCIWEMFINQKQFSVNT